MNHSINNACVTPIKLYFLTNIKLPIANYHMADATLTPITNYQLQKIRRESEHKPGSVLSYMDTAYYIHKF